MRFVWSRDAVPNPYEGCVGRFESTCGGRRCPASGGGQPEAVGGGAAGGGFRSRSRGVERVPGRPEAAWGGPGGPGNASIPSAPLPPSPAPPARPKPCSLGEVAQQQQPLPSRRMVPPPPAGGPTSRPGRPRGRRGGPGAGRGPGQALQAPGPPPARVEGDADAPTCRRREGGTRRHGSRPDGARAGGARRGRGRAAGGPGGARGSAVRAGAPGCRECSCPPPPPRGRPPSSSSRAGPQRTGTLGFGESSFGVLPEGERRGRVRRASGGGGGGRHGVRGASGGVPARGPGFPPDPCPRARPLFAPCFTPAGNTPKE